MIFIIHIPQYLGMTSILLLIATSGATPDQGNIQGE
jgi:hypothetical protein